MRYAWNFDPSIVINIRVLEFKIVTSFLQIGVFFVIEDDDSEAVLGVITAQAARVLSRITPMSSPQQVMKASTVGLIADKT